MRIVFYAGHNYWGGLNGNGGSRTILLSCKTLRDMGHEADVVAHSDKFTWFKHRPVLKHIPKDTDAIVACSISDVKGMNVFAPKTARQYYWMRGLETWQICEEKVKNCLKFGHHNIVNSSWLKRKLDGWGITSDLCWQGVDVDFWYDPAFVKPKHDKIRIGCLHNNHHKTKRWDLFIKLIQYLGYDRYEYWGFGAEKCKDKINCYLKHPDMETLRTFYRNIDIWFAPTELDSFHNPPLEAALCGNLVVCRDIETNGMEDYATPETAMRCKDFDAVISAMKEPDFSKVPKMMELIRTKIGDRRRNMETFAKILGAK